MDILTLFVVGGPLCWIVMIASFLIVSLMVNNDWFWIPIGIMSLFVFEAGRFFTHGGHISLISISLGVIAYLLIGIGWSAYKWKLHILNILEIRLHDEKQRREAIRATGDFQALQRTTSIEEHKRLVGSDIDPRYCKDKISRWIFFWVFQLVANFTQVLSDFIYSITVGIYKRISNKLLQKYLEQLQK